MLKAIQRPLGRYLFLGGSKPMLIFRAGLKVHQYDPPTPVFTRKEKEDIELENAKRLPGEFKKLWQEIKLEASFEESIEEHRSHNDYKVPYTFNTEEDIKQWTVQCDSTYNLGLTHSKLQLSKHRTAVFSGLLDCTTKDGNYRNISGFANMQSLPRRKSFNRMHPYDWTGFDELVIRCRGDGRTYMLNLHCDKYFDVQWNDMHSYPIVTRGGPYWQVVKIPFSKLMLSNDGRVQDDQEFGVITDLDIVSRLSITVGDTCTGPFMLELDYMALQHNKNHTEVFAYERYDVPRHYLY